MNKEWVMNTPVWILLKSLDAPVTAENKEVLTYYLRLAAGYEDDAKI